MRHTTPRHSEQSAKCKLKFITEVTSIVSHNGNGNCEGSCPMNKNNDTFERSGRNNSRSQTHNQRSPSLLRLNNNRNRNSHHHDANKYKNERTQQHRQPMGYFEYVFYTIGYFVLNSKLKSRMSAGGTIRGGKAVMMQKKRQGQMQGQGGNDNADYQNQKPKLSEQKSHEQFSKSAKVIKYGYSNPTSHGNMEDMEDNYYIQEEDNQEKNQGDSQQDSQQKGNLYKMQYGEEHPQPLQSQLDTLPNIGNNIPARHSFFRQKGNTTIASSTTTSARKTNTITNPMNDNQSQELVSNIHSFRRLNFQKEEKAYHNHNMSRHSHSNNNQKRELVNYRKHFDIMVENRLFAQQDNSNSNNSVLPPVVQMGEVLGRGAYAIVREATAKKGKCELTPPHMKTQNSDRTSHYAIKVYPKYKLIDICLKKRVIKEIKLLSRISHPNIITLFGALENSKEIHMVFEHLDKAITLQEYFKHRNLASYCDISSSIDEELSEQEKLMERLRRDRSNKAMNLYILSEVTKAIEYLHKMGIAHRDIKADNIMLSFGAGNGNNIHHNEQNQPHHELPMVKLIDFGFASDTLYSSMQCGTPNYMAPELFISKHQHNTQKADIWALGVLMFYMYEEGRFPFRGYNEKDLVRNINKRQVVFAGDKSPSGMTSRGRNRSEGMEELIMAILITGVDQRLDAKEVGGLLKRIKK